MEPPAEAHSSRVLVKLSAHQPVRGSRCSATHNQYQETHKTSLESKMQKKITIIKKINIKRPTYKAVEYLGMVSQTDVWSYLNLA